MHDIQFRMYEKKFFCVTYIHGDIVRFFQYFTCEEDDMDRLFKPVLQDMELDLDACMDGCDLHRAKELSSAGRSLVIDNAGDGGQDASNLVYGEVNFQSLAVVMCKHLDMKGRKVFYDVGSGSGRGVFCAALIHDFTKACGIEIVPTLSEAAQQQLVHYTANVLPRLESEFKSNAWTRVEQSLSFVTDDFMNIDWTDADIIWANSTCFGYLHNIFICS
jgi:hypothetical protein